MFKNAKPCIVMKMEKVFIKNASPPPATVLTLEKK